MVLGEKYPWIADKEYEFPRGWKIAFGNELCEEIQSVCDRMTEEERSEFHVLQIKEKYGELRFYFTAPANYMKELLAIRDKYELLSWFVCIDCGETATKHSIGWVAPYCDVCADALLQREPHTRFEERPQMDE